MQELMCCNNVTLIKSCNILTCFSYLQNKAAFISRMFFFSTGATTHCGFVFCSPLAGYSLLACEVS